MHNFKWLRKLLFVSWFSGWPHWHKLTKSSFFSQSKLCTTVFFYLGRPLQIFLNVRVNLYRYTLSVLLLINHLSFYFQRSGFTMGRVTDQFSSYLSRRCFSPSASSGTTTITKVRFDKNLVHTVVKIQISRQNSSGFFSIITTDKRTDV